MNETESATEGERAPARVGPARTMEKKQLWIHVHYHTVHPASAAALENLPQSPQSQENAHANLSKVVSKHSKDTNAETTRALGLL